MLMGKGKSIVLIALLIALILLIPAYQEVSYEKVGRELEKFPVVSVGAEYFKTVEPADPAAFFNSLKGIEGYHYSEEESAYVVYVRGRWKGASESCSPSDVERRVYLHDLNQSVNSLLNYLSTGNEKALEDAEFQMALSWIDRVRLNEVEMGDNLTAIVIKPGQPLLFIRENWNLLWPLLLFLTLLTAGILLPLTLVSRLGGGAGWRKAIVAALIILLLAPLGVKLYHSKSTHLSHFREGEMPNATCRSLGYLVKGGAAYSTVMEFRREALYSESRPYNGKEGVLFVTDWKRAHQLIERLREKALVLGLWNISVVKIMGTRVSGYAIGNPDAVSKEVVGDVEKLSGGRIPESLAWRIMEESWSRYLKGDVERARNSSCVELNLIFDG
ncbi:hypothetical protein [Thermococcus sp.]